MNALKSVTLIVSMTLEVVLSGSTGAGKGSVEGATRPSPGSAIIRCARSTHSSSGRWKASRLGSLGSPSMERRPERKATCERLASKVAA